MTNISNPIVFFGTEDFSLIALRSLVEEGYPVAAVVTKPDSAKGRGQQVVAPIVKTFALENNIIVLQPAKLTEIIDDIRELNMPIGVLVSYGKIIPQSIIDLFTPGIINVHPSLLPKYRGPSPIESAILNGDKDTAVSIMQLSSKMDAGPVYGYAPYTLQGNETSSELYAIMGELGAETLLQLLPLILSNEAAGLDQNDEESSYCQLITKTDGIIDWNKPALRIEREIRAYQGWPQSRTTINGIELIITAADVDSSSHLGAGEIHVTAAGRLEIGTKTGTLLPKLVKPLGKKEMPIAAFLSGYRSQLDI